MEGVIMSSKCKYTDLDLKEIYELIKKNFEDFSIHKFLFNNDIQLVFKKHNNANKKSTLAKFQVEYFQFIVKIENTYRSIMLCKKYRKDHGEIVDIGYYFKDDDNAKLIKYRDNDFIRIIKSLTRKEKIKNILEDVE